MATKKTTKKKIKVAEPARVPQLIGENNYSVVLTSDEIVSTIQLLSFSKTIFNQMAEDSLKAGNEKSAQVYAARAGLSLLLFEKFRDVAGIGEPESRELH